MILGKHLLKELLPVIFVIATGSVHTPSVNTELPPYVHGPGDAVRTVALHLNRSLSKLRYWGSPSKSQGS